MPIIGERIPVHPGAFKTIRIYPIAMEEGLPKSNSVIPDPLIGGTGILGIKIQYKLFAHCRQDQSGTKCLYYVAYNVLHKRNEYIVGPNHLNIFNERMDKFAIAAGNFFGLAPSMSGYEAKSMAFTTLFASGEYRSAFRKLGDAWLAALQDPEWWIGATTSVTGVLPSSSAARIFEPNKYASYGRALRTQVNQQNKLVQRSVKVLESPARFRHTITADMPESSLGNIQAEGSLRLSQGHNAHYGEGVYAWGPDGPKTGRYIDIEVPRGTAVETIKVREGTWYRLVPGSGNKLKVKIVGHNFTPKELKWAKHMRKVTLAEMVKPRSVVPQLGAAASRIPKDQKKEAQ